MTDDRRAAISEALRGLVHAMIRSGLIGKDPGGRCCANRELQLSLLGKSRAVCVNAIRARYLREVPGAGPDELAAVVDVLVKMLGFRFQLPEPEAVS